VKNITSVELFKIHSRQPSMKQEPKLQITLLKLQIDVEESNLRYAVELQKDHEVLYVLRDHIRILKEELKLLEANENTKQHR
jgi:hypothetical protein